MCALIVFFFQAFVREGAKVIATDIQIDKLKELEALGSELKSLVTVSI